MNTATLDNAPTASGLVTASGSARTVDIPTLTTCVTLRYLGWKFSKVKPCPHNTDARRDKRVFELIVPADVTSVDAILEQINNDEIEVCPKRWHDLLRDTKEQINSPRVR